MPRQLPRVCAVLVVVLLLVFSSVQSISAKGDYEVITASNAKHVRRAALLKPDSGEIHAIDFNEDGSLLASGHKDSTVHIWDVDAQKELKKFDAAPDGLDDQEKGVSFVGFGPGSTLVSIANDTMMSSATLVWDVKTGKSTRLGEKNFELIGLNNLHGALSPDGTIIAQSICGNEVGFTDDMQMICYSEGFRFIDAKSEKVLSTFDPAIKNGDWTIIFSPDSKILAASGADGVVRLIDVKTGKLKKALPKLKEQPLGLAFSSDGTLLAAGSTDATVTIWNMKTGAVVLHMTTSNEAVESVALSNDGSVLATSGPYGLLMLWNVKTKKEIIVLTGHEDNIMSMSFNPDGTLIATGARDGTIRLWGINKE